MVLARLCGCDRPRPFGTSCHACGRETPARVMPSTRRTAEAIAEVMLGYRRIGDTRSGNRKRTSEDVDQ